MREGWRVVKFKDVATATKGKLPKAKNELGIGQPYLTASFLRKRLPDFWVEDLDGAVTAEDGDCLILWDGAGAGDLFTSLNGVVSSTMAVVKTQHENILREFLTLSISVKSNYIKETCRGTTVPHVSPDAIANMDLSLPPLPEQRRIVDLISAVDAYMEAIQQQLEHGKRARAALLHEMLTAVGDGWQETELGNILQIVAGKYVPKGQYVENGDFWIYGSNSIMGRLDKFLVEQPHVVMAAIGAYAGAVRFSQDPSWINNNAMALVPNEEVDAKFLHLWLESIFDLKRVVVGTGQPYVQRPLLLREKIELPPLNQQIEIANLISSFENEISATERLARGTKQLRSALLTDLLSGNHEIPSSYDHQTGANG